MKYPNFSEEELLQQQGFKCIVGLDEVGRGPLAGPVVAAAVWVKGNGEFLKGINDSKKLSEKQREKFYKILIDSENIKWGIGIVPEDIIDRINIFEATKLAMIKAVKNLNADFLILDGNFVLDIELPQKSIVRGDQKVISISAASIIAKITRDKIMEKYHKEYPQYGFDKHKGYGTKLHMEMINKFGACPIHRKSFRPISELA